MYFSPEATLLNMICREMKISACHGLYLLLSADFDKNWVLYQSIVQFQNGFLVNGSHFNELRKKKYVSFVQLIPIQKAISASSLMISCFYRIYCFDKHLHGPVRHNLKKHEK